MHRIVSFRLPHARRPLIVITFTGFAVALAAIWLATGMRSQGNVEAATAAPVRTQIVDCAQRDDAARSRCARRALEAHLGEVRPLSRALAQVNEDARRDAWLTRRCHVLLHDIGAAWSGPVEPGDVSHDGKDCAAGFVHGWLIEHLDHVSRAEVDAWCGAPRSPLARADCEHAMGHVLVRRADGNVEVALDRCRALGAHSFVQHCASGAYMENRLGGQGRTGATASRYWSKDDPWRPCRNARKDVLSTCSAWAVRDLSADARVAWCSRRLGPRGGRTCRIAAGAVAPVARPARPTCGTDADCWFGRGFTWALLGWDAPDAEPAAAGCADASRRLAEACARGVGMRRAASLDVDDAAAIRGACAGDLPVALVDACRDGAGRRHDRISWV